VIHSRIRDLQGQDPYLLLGIDRTANHDTITRAHRRLIQRTHPDRPGGDEDATKFLHLARDILLDEQLRLQYDQLSSEEPEPTHQPRRSAWDDDDIIHGPTSSAWDDDDIVAGPLEPEPDPYPQTPDPYLTTPFDTTPLREPYPAYPPQYGYPPAYHPYPPQYGYPPAYYLTYPRPPVAPKVASNMTTSIIALIVFLPLGIPAVAYASQVKRALRVGDYAGAVRAASYSRFFSRFALILGSIVFTLACCVCLITGILPASNPQRLPTRSPPGATTATP
jgi:hypothetical protein